MSFPASILLLTVLLIPILQHQWALVLYTGGTVFLGFFVYAALQLARKLNVPFHHNPKVNCDVWGSGALAASFAALPTYTCSVGIYPMLGRSMWMPLTCALLFGCVVGLSALGLVRWEARRLEQKCTLLDLASQDHSRSFRDLDAGEREPMMPKSQNVVEAVPPKDFSLPLPHVISNTNKRDAGVSCNM
jgi:hypothetical protein